MESLDLYDDDVYDGDCFYERAFKEKRRVIRFDPILGRIISTYCLLGVRVKRHFPLMNYFLKERNFLGKKLSWEENFELLQIFGKAANLTIIKTSFSHLPQLIPVKKMFS